MFCPWSCKVNAECPANCPLYFQHFYIIHLLSEWNATNPSIEINQDHWTFSLLALGKSKNVDRWWKKSPRPKHAWQEISNWNTDTTFKSMYNPNWNWEAPRWRTKTRSMELQEEDQYQPCCMLLQKHGKQSLTMYPIMFWLEMNISLKSVQIFKGLSSNMHPRS